MSLLATTVSGIMRISASLLAWGLIYPSDRLSVKPPKSMRGAKMKQARWQKTELEAKIQEELQIAYARVEESLHVLKLYREQLNPLADENLNAAKADYQTGKSDFLTLISSEKTRMQTQLQTEQALADTYRRFAELEYTVGSVEAMSLEGQHRETLP